MPSFVTQRRERAFRPDHPLCIVKHAFPERDHVMSNHRLRLDSQLSRSIGWRLVDSRAARRSFSLGVLARALSADRPRWTGDRRPDPARPRDRRIARAQILTFINPQPDKGVSVFARIALELGARRPDIPILVVEGRATSDTLAALPVDLSALTNLSRMANTPDPRDFYRVSRAVLMPSLWRESLGRVAIEAMANGIPVLASDRGALPETLGDAGFVFTIPDRCTPGSLVIPTPHEVAPWVATIERLWDDPEFEADHRARAKAESKRWDPEFLAGRYQELFHHIAHRPPVECESLLSL